MSVPGFYGKLPSEGDFVTRRLPWDFTTPWDEWLQRGMLASREALGARWLERYLAAPVWRFRLAPGVCGPTGWCGLFFPSVDRVGRYFPMTVAVAEPAVPGSSSPAAPSSLIEPEAAWTALEDAAMAALDPACTADLFDRAVHALLLPPCGPGSAALPGPGAVSLHTEGGPAVPRATHVLAALPEAADFTRLICAAVSAA